MRAFVRRRRRNFDQKEVPLPPAPPEKAAKGGRRLPCTLRPGCAEEIEWQCDRLCARPAPSRSLPERVDRNCPMHAAQLHPPPDLQAAWLLLLFGLAPEGAYQVLASRSSRRPLRPSQSQFFSPLVPWAIPGTPLTQPQALDRPSLFQPNESPHILPEVLLARASQESSTSVAVLSI